jgi:hypothetical protein
MTIYNIAVLFRNDRNLEPELPNCERVDYCLAHFCTLCALQTRSDCAHNTVVCLSFCPAAQSPMPNPEPILSGMKYTQSQQRTLGFMS